MLNTITVKRSKTRKIYSEGALMTIFFVFNLRIYNSIKHRHSYKRVLTCSYPQRKIVDRSKIIIIISEHHRSDRGVFRYTRPLQRMRPYHTRATAVAIYRFVSVRVRSVSYFIILLADASTHAHTISCTHENSLL